MLDCAHDPPQFPRSGPPRRARRHRPPGFRAGPAPPPDPSLAQSPRPAPEAPTPEPSQPPIAERPYASLPAQIAILLASPDVARDHWGIVVTNLDGAPIYSLNEAQLFQPASNAKLFTTAAALALLGPDRTFQTKVIAEGTLTRKGELQGDLVLKGGGDANFGSQLFPYIARPQRAGRKARQLPSPTSRCGRTTTRWSQRA